MARRRCRRGEDEVSEQEVTTTASPPSGPQFFKIVLSHTLESGKLGIPKSFLRRYGKDLSGLVLLKVPDGSTWPVKLEKGNNDMGWLWQGWRKFMEHYSIDYGHLIVFKYEGHSIFHVIIFDKSASEIDYPLRIASDVSSPEDEFPSQKEENIMEIEDIEGFVPCSWPSSKPSSNGLSQEFRGRTPIKHSQCLSPVTAHEKAHKFKSEHPFFHVVILPKHINRYELNIPTKFTKAYIREDLRIATLVYSGRSWEVKLRPYLCRRSASLGTGWTAFAREVGMRKGDFCVFELVDKDNFVLRVSIFRSVDEEVICIEGD